MEDLLSTRLGEGIIIVNRNTAFIWREERKQRRNFYLLILPKIPENNSTCIGGVNKACAWRPLTSVARKKLN